MVTRSICLYLRKQALRIGTSVLRIFNLSIREREGKGKEKGKPDTQVSLSFAKTHLYVIYKI